MKFFASPRVTSQVNGCCFHKALNIEVTKCTHLTSSAKAMIPDAIAVAAEVDANVDVQVPLTSEVI